MDEGILFISKTSAASNAHLCGSNSRLGAQLFAVLLVGNLKFPTNKRFRISPDETFVPALRCGRQWNSCPKHSSETLMLPSSDEHVVHSTSYYCFSCTPPPHRPSSRTTCPVISRRFPSMAERDVGMLQTAECSVPGNFLSLPSWWLLPPSPHLLLSFTHTHARTKTPNFLVWRTEAHSTRTPCPCDCYLWRCWSPAHRHFPPPLWECVAAPGRGGG